MEKIKLSLIIVICCAIIAGGTIVYITLLQTPNQIVYGDITIEQAEELIETRTALIILDVRTIDEFNSGHIEGATNIPIDDVQSRIGELNIADQILVYCRTGNRSRKAVEILTSNGFSKIYHMADGIVGWNLAGNPLVT